MTRPSGDAIAAKKEVKATPINADLDNLDTRVTALEALLSSGKFKLSDVANDMDVPPSWLPTGFGPADGLERPRGIHSQAQHVQGLKLNWKRGVISSDVAADYPGWANPAWGGFLICDQDNDEVHLYTHHPVTGAFAQRVYAMDSGDAPIHAVASSTGYIYVSCPGSMKIRRIATQEGDGTVADFFDFTSIHVDWGSTGTTPAAIRQIYINRHGTYLYIIGQLGDDDGVATNDANFRQLIQLKVSDQTAVVQTIAETTAGEDITGLAMVYPGTADSDTALVAVGIKTVGASTGEIRRKTEDTWGTGTITDVLAAMTAGDFLSSICEYGGGVAAVGYYGAVTGTWSAVYEWDDVAGAVAVLHPLTRDTGNTDEVIDGSAASDGDRVWFELDTGFVATWRAGNQSGTAAGLHPVTAPRGNFTGAGGTYEAPGGCAYTGTEVVVVGDLGTGVAGKYAILTV